MPAINHLSNKPDFSINQDATTIGCLTTSVQVTLLFEQLECSGHSLEVGIKMKDDIMNREQVDLPLVRIESDFRLLFTSLGPKRARVLLAFERKQVLLVNLINWRNDAFRKNANCFCEALTPCKLPSTLRNRRFKDTVYFCASFHKIKFAIVP
jgi:hypothetical protein